MSPYAADVYPIKPIRLLVGFTPGGAADFSARVTSRKMSESLGTNIVVENGRAPAAIFQRKSSRRQQPMDIRFTGAA
jgi:hypothetical protein